MGTIGINTGTGTGGTGTAGTGTIGTYSSVKTAIESSVPEGRTGVFIVLGLAALDRSLLEGATGGIRYYG